MKVIGLTGGIASGKSTVARLLEELGATVIDADQLSREVVRQGTPALTAIIRIFGPEVVSDDGTLNREALGRKIFGDSEARRKLERIVHPAIRDLARRRLDVLRAAGTAVVFYMAPLLIEAGVDSTCDEIWVVDIDEDTQEQRLTCRNGLSREEARRRMASQMPLTEKATHGKVVIDNRGSVQELAVRLKELWEKEMKA